MTDRQVGTAEMWCSARRRPSVGPVNDGDADRRDGGVESWEGHDRFVEVLGAEGAAMVERLRDVAPDLGRYIVEFGYGKVYSRPGLALRERQIAALAALVTQGAAEPQLRSHLGGALRIGLREAEIIEVIVQCLPFVGFPRVLNAVALASEVFSASQADFS
jgi:4-carboxymuconolactone decarboxylase